jgi:tyrosyl-tRNA synthetase
VIFPVNSLTNPSYAFSVERPEKFGGNVSYPNYEALEKGFASKDLHPGDLKAGAAKAINALLEPIRSKFQTDPALIELTAKAYPPPKPKIVAEISKIDLRVGKVISVEQHPERDTLFVEKIDLGEPEPRTIVSGLAKFMTAQEFTGKSVLVVANLKPAKFAGVVSQGMVLAASNADKTLVELLQPPSDATPGSRVTFDGFEAQLPEGVLNPKHKIFEKCAVDFSVREDLVATYKGVEFKVKGQPVTVKSLAGGTIS